MINNQFFKKINYNRTLYYIANGATLGFYGFVWVILRVRAVGESLNVDFPSPLMSLVLAILSVGVYPGVMLSVMAYKLAPKTKANLGHEVLVLNLASLISALFSGGILVVISIVLWAHASWLVVKATNTLSDQVPKVNY